MVVVGHGGRDCWLALVLVEVLALDPQLCARVRPVVLSCTWPDDMWEESMADFLKPYSDFVEFSVFQYHREHHEIVQDLRLRLQGADLVLQCEQGADYFVPPGRSGKHVLEAPFLQDNYEDWIMLYEGLRHVWDRPGAQMWLLQTNSGLDLGKGISLAELQEEVFGEKTQSEGFQQKIQSPGCPRVLDFAIKVGRSSLEERTEAFKLLNVDLGQPNCRRDNAKDCYVYHEFALYCLRDPEARIVPVASLLELMAKLINEDCIVKLEDGTKMPECE